MTFNIRSRDIDSGDDEQQVYPIPDGFMWTDQTGREWTNNGDGNVLYLSGLIGRVFAYELD